MVHGFIVKVSPIELVIWVKFAIHAGIGKVFGFIRFHGHKYLNEWKQPAKNPFFGILLNLVNRLADWHTTAFKLHMNDRHAVNE